MYKPEVLWPNPFPSAPLNPECMTKPGLEWLIPQVGATRLSVPIPSMGRTVYLPTWMVNFYGKSREIYYTCMVWVTHPIWNKQIVSQFPKRLVHETLISDMSFMETIQILSQNWDQDLSW